MWCIGSTYLKHVIGGSRLLCVVSMGLYMSDVSRLALGRHVDQHATHLSMLHVAGLEKSLGLSVFTSKGLGCML